MRVTSEASIQSSLISWWKYAHSGFGLRDHRVLFMVPNGAYFGSGDKILRSGKKISLGAIRFRNLEKQGFVQGVPDLLLIVPRSDKVGLALELKSSEGRLGIEQGQMLALFENQGWAKAIAWSFDEAVSAICNYLKTGDALRKA